MTDLPDICVICLRPDTDRKLKAIAAELSVYHDELIDYSLEITNPRYCNECEYLLKKGYKFLRKCKRAAKILNQWIKAPRYKKMSPSLLYLRLPAVSLDTWTPENSKVYTYACIDDQDEATLISGPDKPAIGNTKEKIDDTSHRENLFKIEILCEDNHVKGISETPFLNFGTDSEDTRNVFQNKLVNDNTIKTAENINIEGNAIDITDDMTEQTNDDTDSRDEIWTQSENQPPCVVLNIEDIKNNISNKNDMQKSSHDIPKPPDTPKLTNDIPTISIPDMPILIHDMPIPTNDTPILTDDIPTISIRDMPIVIHDMPIPTNDTSILNDGIPTISIPDMPIVIHDSPIVIHDMSKSTDDVPISTYDMPILTDAAPILTNDASILTVDTLKATDDSNDKTINKPEVILEFVVDSNKDDVIMIGDESEYQDDASLNSDDDCDDYLIQPPKKTKRKMTLDELADIKLSDDDFDDDYKGTNKQKQIKTKSYKKDYTIDKVLSTEKKIISKLRLINESLDKLIENWEITSLIDVGIPYIPKDAVKKITHKFMTDRLACDETRSARMRYLNELGAKAKLTHLNADLDSLSYNCTQIIEEYKNGQYPKERLKAELIKKFEKWGELKTSDGVVLDKDIIINCLDMVNERQTKQLYNFLDGASRLSPGAARILKRIQNKQHETQYETVFTIQYMNTSQEVMEEFERRKTYECYINAEFKCEICYQGFKHQRLLDYHNKYYHDESYGVLCCTICCVRHRSRRALKRHMNSHEAVYMCKLCPLVTYYKLSMINHYHQHKGILYKCDPCGTTYKSRSVFMYHQSHVHPRGIHVCTVCGRGFVSALGLKTHANRKHHGEEPVVASGSGVKCEMCDVMFPSQESYSKHQRTLHGVKTPMAYKKRRPPRFLKPRKKPNMICRVCDTVGHSYGWLTRHFSTEHPSVNMAAAYADKQTFLCDICGKGFSNKYSLSEHISTHSGVTHPCPTCPKRFSSRLALRRHQPTHFPPRFCCERCGKKFHSYPNLYNHMRSHIGDRRFKCSICGKGFLHRCSLKAHVRGVHNHERRVRKRAAGETSHGVTETPQGVTKTPHGVTETELHEIDTAHEVVDNSE